VYVDETDAKAIARAKPWFEYCFTKVFGTRANGGIGYLRLAENHAKRGDPDLIGADVAFNNAYEEIHAEGDRKLKVARKLRQVAGSRLRDTLWGHCTRSPHLIPLTDACQGVRPENGMFRDTIKAEVVFQSAFDVLTTYVDRLEQLV